jgi:polar amino acid transport system permease protein
LADEVAWRFIGRSDAFAVISALRSAFFDDDRAPAWWLGRVASFLCALGLVSLVCFGAFWALSYHWAWETVRGYWRVFLQGWLMTIGIAALTLPLSSAIGLGFSLLRRSTFLPLRYVARIYVEITRGTPLLVQLYFYWYIFGQALSHNFRFAAGALVLSLFSGAYLSEIIRAGIESVGQSQLESARAIGLTRWQTYRHVIFPQAIRQILPPFAGEFASIIKNSSLLSVLGIEEFAFAASNVSSMTFAQFESYIPVAIGYLVLTLPISLWTQRLEQKARFET